MQIKVEKQKCIAAGQCVLKAPHLFDQSEDDGIVIVLNDTPPDDLKPSARLAAKLCPATAITIEEG